MVYKGFIITSKDEILIAEKFNSDGVVIASYVAEDIQDLRKIIDWWCKQNER